MRFWPRAPKPTPETSASRGRRGEAAAVRYLRSHGYLVERANVRFPVGEIDIVAREGDTLCFVEVRSRSSHEWGAPSESITHAKRQRLIRAARWYLARCQAPVAEARFDVVSVTWEKEGAPGLELIRGAFTAEAS